jgi:catechol 2,3-dioxygenase
MSSPTVCALRSIALEVPDLARAEAFYTDVWHLAVAARTSDAIYLRGTGSDHHLVALHAGGAVPQVLHVTLRARSASALDAIAHAIPETGGSVIHARSAADDPAGGERVVVRDPDGRVFEVVHGDARHADNDDVKDRPARLAHVVLNCHDVPAEQRFLERALGFRLSDRTRIMAFMNCDRDHHSLALADADNDALNHVAFLMPDLESVMRGGGRMRDAGHVIEWGPGRHGPGNNAFNYFIDPFGVVIEYTAEVEQIDETYRAKGPDEWKWPTGRVDHWGISAPPTARLKDAQRVIRFAPAA